MKRREEAAHICPERENIPTADINEAEPRSASSKIMFGDFPPSSRIYFFIPPSRTILSPISVPPVKLTRKTSLCETSFFPVPAPPKITFTTPGGKTSFAIFAKTYAGITEFSDGFMTTVFPEASAGATFEPRNIPGTFQDVIDTTTPNGSFRVKSKALWSNCTTSDVSLSHHSE